MTNSQTTTSEKDNDTLVPPPNYALDVILFITKTILIAAGVLALAWILTNIKVS